MRAWVVLGNENLILLSIELSSVLEVEEVSVFC